MMKNIFNLRFRQKKLLAVIGLAAGLLATPVFQASQAAGPVVLDTSHRVAIAQVGNSHPDFGEVVKVQHGNVVEVSTIVHNTEKTNSGRVAENFRLKVSLPKGPTNSATSRATVSASNAQPSTHYNSSDTASIQTANDRPINLDKPRTFKLQRNHIPDGDRAQFNWDGGSDLPSNRYSVRDAGSSWEITVDPNGNGKLEPCFGKALRIVFLVDVFQTVPGPHMTIEKKVQNQGSASWLDNNSAQVGETMRYAIRISNTGKSKATEVLVRDSLPPKERVTYVAGSCTFKSSSTNGEIPCTQLGVKDDDFVNGGVRFPHIQPGAFAYFYFKVVVKDVTGCSTWFTNTAGVKTKETPEAFDVVKTTVCKKVVEKGKLKIIKFEDKNGSKSQDQGEPRMGSVTFTITGPNGFNKVVQTDTNGEILLTDLTPGQYTATETVPGDFEVTTVNPQNASVVVNQTAVLSFGNKKKVQPLKGSLQVIKFEDKNHNQEQDADEPRMGGVSFTVTGPGGFSKTVVTDSNGEWLLADLEPGSYVVTESVPNGFVVTTSNPQNGVVVANQTTTLKFGNQRLETPTPTPTPPEKTPPVGPPTEKGNLPVTGTSGMLALALTALVTSGYYYIRQRRALAKAFANASGK